MALFGWASRMYSVAFGDGSSAPTGLVCRLCRKLPPAGSTEVCCRRCTDLYCDACAIRFRTFRVAELKLKCCSECLEVRVCRVCRWGYHRFEDYGYPQSLLGEYQDRGVCGRCHLLRQRILMSRLSGSDEGWAIIPGRILPLVPLECVPSAKIEISYIVIDHERGIQSEQHIAYPIPLAFVSRKPDTLVWYFERAGTGDLSYIVNAVVLSTDRSPLPESLNVSI